MKKILVTTAVAVLILAACNKKSVTPMTPSNDVSSPNPMTQEYKYSKDIRVYDDSKTYYMDITVKSNDEKAFDANVMGLTNSKIELIKKEPVMAANEALKTAPQKNNAVSPKEDNNLVYIDIQKINKGKAKGVRLCSQKDGSNEQANKTDFVYGGNGNALIHIGPCYYYTMYGRTFGMAMN
ncbi:MAG: hypothetical protein ABIP51_11910, partial [Bacteroidia bacterium]